MMINFITLRKRAGYSLQLILPSFLSSHTIHYNQSQRIISLSSLWFRIKVIICHTAPIYILLHLILFHLREYSNIDVHDLLIQLLLLICRRVSLIDCHNLLELPPVFCLIWSRQKNKKYLIADVTSEQGLNASLYASIQCAATTGTDAIRYFLFFVRYSKS